MATDKPKKPTLKGKHAHRVAFLATREKIDEFLREGYTWQAIYNFFVDTSVFTMSYSTFCRYMNGLNKPVKNRVEVVTQPVITKVVEPTHKGNRLEKISKKPDKDTLV